MDMVGISKCSMVTCAYYKAGACHTLGITVGPHAECNTYVHASSRGGFPEVKGGIGACRHPDVFSIEMNLKSVIKNVTNL